MKNLAFALGTAFILALIGCNQAYSPKPKGFYRIDLPEKAYVLFDSTCPFVFEYPKYGNITPDQSKNAEPCWINIAFPKYKGKIHLSYKVVKNNVDGYIEDCHNLAYEHAFKADGIEESVILSESRHIYGLIYDIKGNTASSVQFYVTDSTRNFLRGALYFETQPNKDSLAPVISFFRQDIVHLIETLKWK
jgi:gliding motility-associated lipoprotein GldD